MNRVYQVTAFGHPAPQGSKKYVGHRGGRPVLAESSSGVGPWRRAVEGAVAEAGFDSLRLSDAVHVRLDFRLARPKSHYNRSGLRPGMPRFVTTTPDLDKLVRSTLDALVMSGLLADDKYVAGLQAMCVYTEGSPRADIAVQVLDENTDL